MAWLFDRTTSTVGLEAERRIRAGDVPAPQALRGMAQRRWAPSTPIIEDRPLNAYEVLLLIITEVVMTPLVGLALWHGLRGFDPVPLGCGSDRSSAIASSGCSIDLNCSDDVTVTSPLHQLVDSVDG